MRLIVCSTLAKKEFLGTGPYEQLMAGISKDDIVREFSWLPAKDFYVFEGETVDDCLKAIERFSVRMNGPAEEE